MPVLPLLPLLPLLLAPRASATTLSERSSETVEAGVTLTQYRASSPSTDVWVLSVDLCADDVYVDATRESDDYQSTKSWGSDMDLTAATNGDFYKTDPVRVYGDAVGGGVRWPSTNTGRDTDYDGEWYWEHYGWIAFQHDGVAFSHTGWVKENVSGLGYGTGNDDLTPDLPSGVLALVSGFPELVVEGAPVVCSDPEASDCFPDRSDMRERHPRTAMGITEDLSTFLLVVADGRTSDNDGLYGSELADILEQLGAWEAFNLDGGGSSQLWTDADGYVNDYDGNNYGSGARTVANHWGVFAGGRGYLPARPGHCAAASPCETIPAAGGILDDAGACFRGFGDQQYWRDESVGYGGGLVWTNAFEGDLADNWAWWQVNPVEAGDYEVFTYADSAYAAWDDVEYQVRAGGAETTIRVDPTGQDGWVSLGVYTFGEGGDQWVALFDNQADAPGSDKHIVADAVKLERVGAWCGDGACSADEQCACADCPVTEEVAGNGIDDDCDGSVDEAPGDSGDPADSEPGETDADTDTGAGAAKVQRADTGCGCSADPGGQAGALVAAGAAGLLLARRRRAWVVTTLTLGCSSGWKGGTGPSPNDSAPSDDTSAATDTSDSSPLDSGPDTDTDTSPPDTGTSSPCGDPGVLPTFATPSAPALSPVSADSDNGADNIYAPDVVRVSDTLCLLYYGGQGGDGHDRIFVATSNDCATWAPWPHRDDPAPILDNGSSNHVNDPSVVVVGGTWYLYYTDAATAEDDRVHLATSTDGFSFAKRGEVLGVGSPGAWDSVKVGRPSVVHREGAFWLYYDGNDGTSRHVGLATSTDGRTFVRHPANPLVLNAGAVDVERIADTWVMVQESGSGTLAATSADGLTWCDQGAILPLTGADWDAYGQVTPFVWTQDGSRVDALLFGGASDACWCRNRIGQALPAGDPVPVDPDVGCGGCVAESDCTEACRDGGYGVDGYCGVPSSVDPGACCTCVGSP